MSKGLRKGLTSYGDAGFSLFLRKAFIKASGYSEDALERPIIGVTDTFSDFNPCHGNMPELIESVKPGSLPGRRTHPTSDLLSRIDRSNGSFRVCKQS